VGWSFFALPSLFLRSMLAPKQGQVLRILCDRGRAFLHMKRDSRVLTVRNLSKVGAALVQGWCSLGARMVQSWCKDGAVLVRGWCSLGAVLVRGWCEDGAALVRGWCSLGAEMVQPWCEDGAVLVRGWCGDGAGTERHGEISGRRA
jgi:hypothetical protein